MQTFSFSSSKVFNFSSRLEVTFFFSVLVHTWKVSLSPWKNFSFHLFFKKETETHLVSSHKTPRNSFFAHLDNDKEMRKGIMCLFPILPETFPVLPFH